MIDRFMAARMADLGTETAFEVLAKASALEAQGRDIVHMEIGQPDFKTPAHIRKAGADAIEAGLTGYVNSAGIPTLRESIARYISETRGIPVAADEVVVTPGGKPIMYYTIIVAVNPGDEVIYPNPGFPIYESVIRFMGGVPVPLPLREEKDFRLDVDELRSLVTDKTRLIIINSPANPTGGVLTYGDVKAIAEIIGDRDILVLSDEIYSRIIYEGEPHSIASEPGLKEKTIILDGFSKTYSMTGWRLGYGVMPKHLAQAVERLVINSVSCTPGFVQMAGKAALEGPQDSVDAMNAEFRQRRDFIVAGLNDIPGAACRQPAGAFYVFPNFKSFGKSSKELGDYLLYEGGVACLPGTSFGAYGEGYVRLSYATSLEKIDEGLKRIRGALGKL